MSQSRSKKAAAAGVVALAAAVASFFGLRGTEQVTTTRQPNFYETSATIDAKYRVADRPPQNLTGVAKYIKKRMALPRNAGKGYRFKMTGTDDWSRIRPLKRSIEKFKIKLSKSRLNKQWVFQSMKSKFRIFSMKIDVNPAVATNTPGTNAIDIIVGTTLKKFPNAQIWGICVCKRISGTYTWSQHAFCNAVDWGGSTTLLDSIAKYQRSLMAKGYLPVAELLWRVPNHYNHIHDTGAPKLGGSPSCAYGRSTFQIDAVPEDLKGRLEQEAA